MREPVQDALRAYFELAMGLTDASRKRAEKVVKRVVKDAVGRGQATATQIQSMAEDLITTSAANREAVARLVRVELDKALARMGVATSEEVAALTSRIDALERQLRDQAAAKVAPVQPPQADAVEGEPAARKPMVAKKVPMAKKAPVAKKAPSTTTTAKKADAPASTPRKAVTVKKTAKKAAPPPGEAT